jgi:hypothetical protein
MSNSTTTPTILNLVQADADCISFSTWGDEAPTSVAVSWNFDTVFNAITAVYDIVTGELTDTHACTSYGKGTGEFIPCPLIARLREQGKDGFADRLIANGKKEMREVNEEVFIPEYQVPQTVDFDAITSAKHHHHARSPSWF